MNQRYSYKFLPEQFAEEQSITMAFFVDGVLAGAAEFDVIPDQPAVVQIHKTELNKTFRNQGHGVPLYKAIFECAGKIGATKIQSDEKLTADAARIWAKLSRALPVTQTLSGLYEYELHASPAKEQQAPRCYVCGRACVRGRFRCRRCIKAGV
ncbi:MAG TPA: GNAT family N-acetyltransferase [Candidatus Dormibacteraeota bacterium]|nr:GNAT family N-acetyltransferase [Candidatus Dormibacteraeota bacterium]